jgi:tyrosyl-tRNA synthetase
MGILPGTDGEVKMSKSQGNYIPINSTADDMYGKLMSVPDKAMPQYYRLVTRWTPAEIDALEKDVSSGKVHPKVAKMKMSREVTEIFYGAEAAERAEANFDSMFRTHSLPDNIPVYASHEGQTVLDVMVEANLVSSKSEGRRLMQQNGVRLLSEDGTRDEAETLTDPNMVFPHPGVLQVGKRHYLKITM